MYKYVRIENDDFLFDSKASHGAQEKNIFFQLTK